MTTQGIKYGMILLTGLLLVIMSTAVVPSEPVVKCYNDTDGNSMCFLAEPSRDTRLRQWSAARDYCRNNVSATLPIINSTLEQFQLTEFLLGNDYTLDSVWLGVQGFSSGWTWVNQTSYSGSLNTTYLGLNVASIGQRINGNETVATLFEDNMDFTAAGYICQFEANADRTVCPNRDAGASVSYVYGSSCFARYDDSVGWYLARNKCLWRGGDLAILPDSTPSGINSMLSGLGYTLSDKPNVIKRYWVGLRKVWWKRDSDGKEMTTVLLRDSSALENVTFAEQNCLAVDYKQQFAWSIRDCSVKLQTICQSGSYPVLPPTSQPIEASPTQTVSLPVWAVGLICGIAGLIYIVSLTVVGIICCKCCGKRGQGSHDSQRQASNHRGDGGYAEDGMDYEIPEDPRDVALRGGVRRRANTDSEDYELPCDQGIENKTYANSREF